MKRLLPLLALLAAFAPPAAAAPYAGQVREAAATFRLRGVDGHTFTLVLVARSSGLGGTSDLRELELTLTECAGARCAPAHRHLTTLEPDQYAESPDLGVTQLVAQIGSLVLGVAWSSDAGFGSLPPALETTGGVVAKSRRAAVAVLLAGPRAGDRYRPVARCVDQRAEVRLATGVVTADRAGGDWPGSLPPGLVVKPRSSRLLTCR